MTAVSGPPQAPDGPPDGEKEIEPVYGTLDAWVELEYSMTFVRHGATRWCRKWHAHAEAIVRLTALWHTWERAHLGLDGGMADWITRYLDQIAPVLHAANGPFASCTPDRHVVEEPWPVLPAPAGYFT